MSLLDSPSLSVVSSPLGRAHLDSEAYVLSIASLPSFYAASSSAPTNAIHLFDKASLRSVQQLPAHDVAISALRSVHDFTGSAREVLVSCGEDGTVKIWDERTGSMGLQLTATTAGRPRALLSCDVSSDGLTIAAGTDLQGDDASILYWDARSPAAPLRAHTSTHSDDITAVHFYRPKHTSSSSNYRNLLLSTSSDGLISTSNADEEDEDEAGVYVGNWGCSIAQAGWVYKRSGSPGIWAGSDMETFSVWSSELDQIHEGDIRQPSIHRQDLTWVTDYLIGCHNNSSFSADMDNGLSIFTGSNEGDIALLSRSTFSDENTPWALHRLWAGAHVGVVRSVLWDERNNVLLSGGEDSQLNAWSCPPLPISNNDHTNGIKREEIEDHSMDVDDSEDTPPRKRRQY